MQSHNAIGLSAISSEIAIIAATLPTTPVAPTTVISGTNVLISWIMQDTGGSVITSYTVKIRQSDNATYTSTSLCDGTSAQVVSDKSCLVPVAALTTPPFNLPWGSSVFANVLATNIIGSSGASPGGNGAIILITPDSPRNLTNVPSITTATQIGLTWATGSANGGTPVIDY